MGHNRAFYNPTPEQLAAVDSHKKLVRFINSAFKKSGRHWVENYITYLEKNPGVNLPAGVTMDREDALSVCREALRLNTEEKDTRDDLNLQQKINDHIDF